MGGGDWREALISYSFVECHSEVLLKSKLATSAMYVAEEDKKYLLPVNNQQEDCELSTNYDSYQLAASDQCEEGYCLSHRQVH